MRIYERRQEKEKKHAFDQENVQEKKKAFSLSLGRFLGRERVFFLFFPFFLDRFLGRDLVFFFLLSCFLLQIPTPDFAMSS